MRRVWTPQEVERLKRLAARGLTLRDAARFFPGRTAETVRYKARKLGIRFANFAPYDQRVSHVTIKHRWRRTNRLDGYSPLSIHGHRMLEAGLTTMARHGRDGHVTWGGVRMPYADAISNLLWAIHSRARLVREARRTA